MLTPYKGYESIIRPLTVEECKKLVGKPAYTDTWHVWGIIVKDLNGRLWYTYKGYRGGDTSIRLSDKVCEELKLYTHEPRV